MTLTQFRRDLLDWADPVWWARQQLDLMTATTAYLTRVTAALTGAAATVPAESAADEPPVAGWDDLSVASIRARLSRLSETDLVTLQAYELHHAARPDVLSMLANRLAKLRPAN
ncbi:MAG: hypothetical protein JO016_11180 [Actinobacteria bacterium]|nr:hypothetical protein [Actinomycetota bacterium]